MARANELPAAKVHETNIEKVVQLEAEQEKHAPANRLSEAIAKFASTNVFVLAQLGCVGLWLAINSGVIIEPFDPYPFVILGVLLALEGCFSPHSC